MRKLKRSVKCFCAVAMVMLCVSTLNTNAAKDGNHKFSFVIKGSMDNARVKDGDARYRGTTNPRNMWKVKMITSDECNGKGKTVTNYWIENRGGDNLSKEVSAKKGDAVYCPAKAKASRVTVYLTGENNNWSGDEYQVTGVWDEETGRISGN